MNQIIDHKRVMCYSYLYIGKYHIGLLYISNEVILLSSLNNHQPKLTLKNAAKHRTNTQGKS